MTELSTAAIAVATLLLLGLTAALHLRPRVNLNGLQLFQMWLSASAYGEHKNDNQDDSQWAKRLAAASIWNPSLPHIEVAIAHPERLHREYTSVNLRERLIASDDERSRWHLLFRDNPNHDIHDLFANLDADPAYSPANYLGSHWSWEAIIGGRPWNQATALNQQRTWVIVGRPHHPDIIDLTESMANIIGPKCHLVSEGMPVKPEYLAHPVVTEASKRRTPDELTSIARFIQVLTEVVPDISDRLVLVGVGPGIQTILETMRTAPALRDRVDGVVSIGGIIRGLDGAEGHLAWDSCMQWLQNEFRHDTMDLEAVGTTPYFCMQWLNMEQSPPGAHGLRLENSRFPTPSTKGISRESIDVVDLGVVDIHSGLEPQTIARAIWGSVRSWLDASSA